MELLIACQMIYSVMAQQKLTMQEHQQVQVALEVAAPKCKAELEKAQKKEEHK